jgi:hypothetical protein
MSMPNIQVFGKQLEKLIETVGKGIGVLYKPKAIRNEADAEAYKIEAIAKAKVKASMIKADVDNLIVERAKQRLYHLEIGRQMNLDNIVDNSTKFLNESVSDKPVDDDWRTRFFTKAQDITSDELQIIWGKILATEVNGPGNISLRTLDILGNLSRDEALKFTDFCGMTNQFGDVIKITGNSLNKYGITFDDLLLLREAGLVNPEAELRVKYLAHPIKLDEERNAVALKFQHRGFVIYKQNTTEHSFEAISLTRAGRELLSVIPVNFSELYYEDLRKKLEKFKFIVTETRLAYVLKK